MSTDNNIVYIISVALAVYISFFTASTNLLCGLAYFLLSGSSVFNILFPVYPLSLLFMFKPSQACLSNFLFTSSDFHSSFLQCTSPLLQGLSHLLPTLTADYNFVIVHRGSCLTSCDNLQTRRSSELNPDVMLPPPQTHLSLLQLTTSLLSAYMFCNTLMYFFANSDFFMQYHSFSLDTLT